MKIKVLEGQHRKAWNQAVADLPEATFFHLVEWQEVIAGSYGFTPYYLYAEDCTGICGILPLYHVRIPLLGSSLMSSPLGVYGGAIATSTDIQTQLEDVAVEQAKELSVGHLELRNVKRQREGWAVNEAYSSFQRELYADEEANLLAIPRKQRAEVRKGIKAELSTRVHRDVDGFFQLYARSVRDLGSPIYPKRYFQLLLDIFSKNCGIHTVYKADQPLTTVMNFYFKDTVLPYYGGGVADARNYSAFPFMYWELMRMSAQQGYRNFDFGRSLKGSGAFSFKKNFGFKAHPLNYQYQLISAKHISGADPDNSAHKMLSRLWRHLPLSVANRLGPLVSRMIV